MYWSDVIREYTQALSPVTTNQDLIQRMIGLIDLTSLNSSDTEATIAALCEKAQTSFGHVAAVCVNPQFVRQVVAQFKGTAVKTVTVANFPEGGDSLESVLISIGSAIQNGVAEVDVVFPYHRYLAGERQYAHTFVETCKAACGDQVILKVILETGALLDPGIIADASYDVLSSGADFIKTSTGKSSSGATLEAVTTMLLVIQHISPQLKRPVGIKVSGGIREISQAGMYVELAEKIMGPKWVTADTFRIGASKLVDEMSSFMSVTE